MTTTGRVQELDSPAEVLGFVRACRAEADAAEAGVLLAAVTWAEQHPPESIHLAATWPTGGAETGVPLAGEGAPLVAEFCLAEFAAALRLSTDSGRALIAEAVELKHRLPRTWARVGSGELPAWRARRVAATTIGLTREAAWFVDAQVAPFAHKIGPAALDRLVAEAVARFMPAKAAQDARDAADGRHLRIHHDQVSFSGTSHLEGELDLADALDLDAALALGAESLKTAGCTESLEVRRAIAAGEIARHQLTLDLHPDTEPDPANGPQRSTWPGGASGGAARPPQRPGHHRQHRQRSRGVRGAGAGGEHRCGDHRRAGPGLVRQPRGHHRGPTGDRPAGPLRHRRLPVPDRLRTQAEERDHTCVFPWCTRAARACDCDHVIARDRGGTTCSCNIAPLCRRHHRLKTKTTWTYTVLEPGTYLWSSPHGYQFLREATGTLDVTRERPPPDTTSCQLRADPPEH